MTKEILTTWFKHMNASSLNELKKYVYNRGFSHTMRLTAAQLAEVFFNQIPEDEIIEEIENILG